MSQKLKPPRKVLINGCSHSRACIPDCAPSEHYETAWPRLLAKLLKCEVVNIASDGKSVPYTLEETIRTLLNPHQYTDVVVQLSDWERINLYARSRSHEWDPGVVETQVTNTQWYVKIPALDPEDLHINRTIGNNKIETVKVGDVGYTYERITAGTLLNCLNRLCEDQGVNLRVLNYFGFGDTMDDWVFDNIPDTIWLATNPEEGWYNDMLWRHDTPDTYHFSKSAHPEIAHKVADNLATGRRYDLSTVDFDEANKRYIFHYD